MRTKNLELVRRAPGPSRRISFVLTFFLPLTFLSLPVMFYISPMAGLLFYSVGLVLLFFRERAYRNRQKFRFGPEFLEFAGAGQRYFFPSWVKARWEDVVKVRSYETLDEEWVRVPGKKIETDIGKFEVAFSKVGFIPATKVFVPGPQGAEEESFAVDMSSDQYFEFLELLGKKVPVEKMDDKTRQLMDPKNFVGEFIKKKETFSPDRKP